MGHPSLISDESVEHPILEELNADQQAMIDIIAETWLSLGRWPVYDYVSRKLLAATGADPISVLTFLPVIRKPVGHGTYHLVTGEEGGPFAERAKRIGLTIGGLFHNRHGRHTAKELVQIIGAIAELDANLAPDPDRAIDLDIPLADLLPRHTGLGQMEPREVARSLSAEPPLWGAVQPSDGGIHRVRPDSRLSGFRGVSEPDDYLRRCVVFLRAHNPSAGIAPAVRSPLDLPEAIGYLDVVWRLRYDTPLLTSLKPAAAAKLALPCASGDEFDSRLSALADVLSQIRVDLPAEADRDSKDLKEKSLARLQRRLRTEPGLTEESKRRIDEAIDTLRVAIRIRVAGQHSGLDREVAHAFAALGMTYPPRDPVEAWEQIRTRCANALDAIREELQADDT